MVKKMNEIIISNEEQEAIEVEGFSISGKIMKLNIETDRDVQVGADLLGQIKAMKKKAKDFLDPAKQKAHETWKEICNRQNELIRPLEHAEKIIKSKIKEYELIKLAEKKKREEEARLLQAKIDAEKAEASKKADLNALFKAEEEEEQVKAYVEEPVTDVRGIHTRTTYSFEITDPDKVPVKTPMGIIRPIDEKMLANIAKLSKGTAQIEGVRFFEDLVVVNR